MENKDWNKRRYFYWKEHLKLHGGNGRRDPYASFGDVPWSSGGRYQICPKAVSYGAAYLVSSDKNSVYIV